MSSKENAVQGAMTASLEVYCYKSLDSKKELRSFEPYSNQQTINSYISDVQYMLNNNIIMFEVKSSSNKILHSFKESQYLSNNAISQYGFPLYYAYADYNELSYWRDERHDCWPESTLVEIKTSKPENLFHNGKLNSKNHISLMSLLFEEKKYKTSELFNLFAIILGAENYRLGEIMLVIEQSENNLTIKKGEVADAYNKILNVAEKYKNINPKSLEVDTFLKAINLGETICKKCRKSLKTLDEQLKSLDDKKNEDNFKELKQTMIKKFNADILISISEIYSFIDNNDSINFNFLKNDKKTVPDRIKFR